MIDFSPHFPTLNETLRFFHYFVCGIKNVAEICMIEPGVNELGP